MVDEQMQRPQRVARWLAIVLLGLAFCFVAFLVWTGRPALAADAALHALTSDAQVTVTTEPWLVFTPTTPTITTGFIFYPGGRVDPRAYAPAAHAIAAAGYLVVIVPMPLNLAILAPGRAQTVIAAYPAIRHWAIGGHSLGGAMAANFVTTHPGAVEQLILWGAYPNDTDSLANRTGLVTTLIYGTADGIITAPEVTAARRRLPEQTQFVAIQGGNHAQFGWYGEQPGDQPATIDRTTQQAQVIAATLAVLAQQP